MPRPRSSSRIHWAALSRKYRSCVTATTVPGNLRRNCSSHSTLSASRWLVGSSSSRMSGLESNSRHSATRLFSPPESGAIFCSQGGRRSASAATSICRSALSECAALTIASSSACSAASLSKSASGSAYAEPDADFDKLAAEQAELEAIVNAAHSDSADLQMDVAADALRLPPWEQKIAPLSGGEKRRVALCRLLLS